MSSENPTSNSERAGTIVWKGDWSGGRRPEGYQKIGELVRVIKGKEPSFDIDTLMRQRGWDDTRILAYNDALATVKRTDVIRDVVQFLKNNAEIYSALQGAAGKSIKAETSVVSVEKKGGWTGNWKKGERPPGYYKPDADMDSLRLLSGKEESTLADILTAGGWGSDEISHYSDLQKAATERGRLTEAETGELLALNARMKETLAVVKQKLLQESLQKKYA